jgi:hypothetical protein
MISLYVSSLVPSARMAVMVTYGPLLFAGTVGLCPCLCAGSQMASTALGNLTSSGGIAAAILTAFGVLTPALSPLETIFYLVIAPLTVWGLFVGWLYLLTTNRLLPAWANRATPLRVFYLVFLVAGVLQGAAGISWAAAKIPAADLGQALAVYWLAVSCGLAAALSFASESPILSYRLREEWEQLRGRWSFRRLLFPGPRTGSFVLLAGGVAGGLLAGLLLAPCGSTAGIGPAAMARLQTHVLVPLLGTLVLGAGLGLLLGTYTQGEGGRRWTVYVLVSVLSLLPAVVSPGETFALATTPRSDGYYLASGLSPLLSAWDLQHLIPIASTGSAVPGPAHLLGGALYAAIGLVMGLGSVARRRIVEQRMKEVVRKETTIIRRKRGPAALRDLPPPAAGEAPKA